MRCLMPNHITRLSEHLYVYHGTINVGIISNENQALLIDFGDGSVQSALDELNITKVDSVLFTHHHRDQASGVWKLVKDATKIGVPEQEKPWFNSVETYWNDPKTRWHLYNLHPHNLMLAESVPVTDTYKEGDIIQWNDARISAFHTPGHTDGSLSYLVEVDGSTFAFCGDVIYDKGQIWELYSLQKGETTTDYHGFLGSRKELKGSLLKLKALNPAALIPSHGNIMKEPSEAIDALINRLDECYDKYVAISALRYYFPAMFTEFEGRDGHIPIRSGKEPPDFLRHIGTTWLIVSQTGEAFVMDCGGQNVINQVQAMQEQKDISSVAGLWITHYHDDHVDAIPQFQKTFGCPVYADSSIAEVVENPLGFRTPCISPAVIKVDYHTTDGQSWQWNEFKMTAYHFPGQTLYHGGLLVEGRGVRLFFAGDSFTMSGIDDYCSQNRNFLGKGVGFDRCLKLIQDLNPTHIFNCHVGPAFDFTPEELRLMRENLAQREILYGRLFPWDSPNYGIDEYWIRCYPYEQEAKAGEKVELRIDITNHSGAKRYATCRPILPGLWNMEINAESAWIPSKSDGHITFSFTIPENAVPGRWIIPIDITYNDQPFKSPLIPFCQRGIKGDLRIAHLGQFREACFTVVW
jgi:glyoxylase-like metal-dependent hydrolase (beta-lactamase superfamily II)